MMDKVGRELDPANEGIDVRMNDGLKKSSK